MPKDLKSNIFDTALIFEGGGMRASYTCAFVNMLLENEIYFDNVYGLSAGASNAINYVSRDLSRAKASFVDLVKDPDFGGVSTFLQGKGYFSADHIYQEMGLPGGFAPFDMETFLANPAKLTIEAFGRDTGKSVYWTKNDMRSLSDLMMRLQASSSLPIVMPSPLVDGAHYYDGGLGEGAGFLLTRAKQDGFDRFLIVRTRPKGYRKQAPVKLSDRLISAMLWRCPHVRAALNTRWARYNAVCDEIERLEQEGKAYVFYADGQSVSSGEKDIDKLLANYEAGYSQASKELAAIKNFLSHLTRIKQQ